MKETLVVPSGVANPPRGLPLPFDNPLSDLHPTAQAIITTAQQIIADEGLHRLTLRAIAERANVNISAVKYHFGSKAGLMAVVLDATVHDEALKLVSKTYTLTGEERLHAYISGVLAIVNSTRAYRSYYELQPAVLRSPRLKQTEADLYRWYVDWTSLCLGLDGLGLQPETSHAIAQMLVAMSDGLALQRLVDEDAFPAEAAHVVLEKMLRAVLRGDLRLE